MRVAIVHDWLTGHRGGERVLERLLVLWPDAVLFTLVHQRRAVPASIEAREIRTSFLQSIPGLMRHYRMALPLFPTAIEALDLREFDAVIASSHCVAHGVHVRADAVFVALVHTPARYAWDLESEYLASRPALAPFARPLLARFRAWDVRAAQRPRALFAVSHHVAERIRRQWGRSAGVVHPGIDPRRFARPRAPDEEYLVFGALTPNKRVHVAIDACARLGRPLLVAGEGPLANSLRRRATPGCRFLGAVPETRVPELYARARALLFPGVEDFGLVPLEAMAAGCPVIALAEGGALETVGRGQPRPSAATSVPGGVLYQGSTAAALAQAIVGFESSAAEGRYDDQSIRATARSFTEEAFEEALLAAITGVPGGEALAANAVRVRPLLASHATP